MQSISAASTIPGPGSPRAVPRLPLPAGVTLLDGRRYDVAFAGHTHGGQIAAPDGRPLFRPSGPGSRHYSYGRYEIPGNGPLFVSCGVGCSGIPVRINADPELVICTLGAQGS